MTTPFQNFVRMTEYVTWKPVPMARDFLRTTSQLVGWRQALAYSAVQLTISLVGGYASFLLQDQLYGAFGKLDQYWVNLDDADPSVAEASWNGMQETLLNMPILLIGDAVLTLGIGLAKNMAIQHMDYRLKEAFYETVFHDQIGYAIDSANNAEAQDLLHGTARDLSDYLGMGTRLLASAVMTAQKGMLSFQGLLGFSRMVRLGPIAVPDLLAYTLVYSGATYMVTALIGKPLGYFQKKLHDSSVHFEDMSVRAMAAMKWITLANVEKAAEQNLQQTLQEGRHSARWTMVLEEISNAWQKFHGFANSCIGYGFVGSKIVAKEVTVAGAAQIFRHMQNVYGMVGWSEASATTLQTWQLSQNRINEFLTILEKEKAKEPCTMHGNSPDKRMIVQGKPGKPIAVKLLDKNLSVAQQERLEFAPGDRILVSGRNGEGKSSFLAALRGITRGPVQLDGTILYPVENGQKVFPYILTQTAYVPQGTLTDIAFSGEKRDLSAADKAKFKALLQRMNMDAPTKEGTTTHLLERLDEHQHNWESILSGGQLQKLRLAAAVLLKPAILLVDEGFSALDREAKAECMRILQEELDESCIVVIDHQDNPNNPFYTHSLSFHQGQILPGIQPEQAQGEQRSANLKAAAY